MAERPEFNMNEPDDQANTGVPFEHEPLEVEDDAPRRAASARFIVDAEVGSDAALRDAMDPANQSLAEALRLSYRVLQAVIVVLVVLFLASGFQTVDEGQTGVRTVFGSIAKPADGAALKPGAQFSIYPYPIGEFITFAENRTVDVNVAFTPSTRNLPRERQLELASISNPLTPASDGSLLTRDGDLAHLDFSARFFIENPEAFVETVSDAHAERGASALVRLAMQRAAIQTVTGLSLQDVIDFSDDSRTAIQTIAQAALDDLKCGIQITQVQVHRGFAPLALESALGDYQAAKVAADDVILNASKNAGETLSKVAGQDYRKIMSLIESYERALEKGDAGEASEALSGLNAAFESDKAEGEIASIIQQARSYQSYIESTLGAEFIRFESLLPTFRENPRLVVTKEWLDVFSRVFNHQDTEIFYVHPMMAVRLGLAGSTSIQDIRRKADIARKQREAMQRHIDPMGYIPRAADMVFGREGRQLKQNESGGLQPFGGKK